MKIIATNLPLGLDQLTDEDVLSDDPIKTPIEYECDDNKKKIKLKIVDIPEDARKLLLILAAPEKAVENSSYWITWAMMNPRDSPFVVNRNTKLKKKYLKKEDYKNNWRGNSDNFYEAMCDPFIKAYKILVYALGNGPKIDPKITREDLKKMIDGYVVDSTEILATYIDKKDKFL